MEKTNFREGNAKVYMTHPTKVSAFLPQALRRQAQPVVMQPPGRVPLPHVRLCADLVSAFAFFCGTERLLTPVARLSNAGNSDDLFSESEMLASWRSIEAVDYHQEVTVAGGLSFTSYHAGHVLGAAMFLIEIAGLKILYTGDFSREEDRHLVQAEVPAQRPDVLISESTYGVQSLEPRLDKEHRFTSERCRR